ncbi:hypothetical protein DL765_008120 [Monosporascus sp. GIB2]|nr:hypothetical protein DL765_008120 [Monosporascus sp. GIB2]
MSASSWTFVLSRPNTKPTGAGIVKFDRMGSPAKAPELSVLEHDLAKIWVVSLSITVMSVAEVVLSTWAAMVARLV